MKRMIAVLLIAVLAFSLVACAKNADNDKKEETAEPTEELMTTDIGLSEIDGGWSGAESYTVTDEIKALFDKVNETLTVVQFEPVAYLESQVVAGTNHLVLCKETATVPEGIVEYALVTLYEDLDGNVEITQTLESGVFAPDPDDPENPTEGDWAEPETPEATDEAKAALEKACELIAGVTYNPVVLLGTQIVAGTNYMLLCKETVVTPDAVPSYLIVTVYEDPDGNAEITEKHAFSVLNDVTGVYDSEADE